MDFVIFSIYMDTWWSITWFKFAVGSWSHGVAIFFFFKNKGRKREGREKREENDFLVGKKEEKLAKCSLQLERKLLGYFR